MRLFAVFVLLCGARLAFLCTLQILITLLTSSSKCSVGMQFLQHKRSPMQVTLYLFKVDHLNPFCQSWQYGFPSCTLALDYRLRMLCARQLVLLWAIWMCCLGVQAAWNKGHDVMSTYVFRQFAYVLTGLCDALLMWVGQWYINTIIFFHAVFFGSV